MFTWFLRDAYYRQRTGKNIATFYDVYNSCQNRLYIENCNKKLLSAITPYADLFFDRADISDKTLWVLHVQIDGLAQDCNS